MEALLAVQIYLTVDHNPRLTSHLELITASPI